MIEFETLLAKTKPHLVKPTRLLCFDPGVTTGWAFYLNNKIHRSGTLTHCDIDTYRKLAKLFNIFMPNFVVLEDYVVYANRVKEHINSPLFVPKLIGRIIHECDARKIGYHEQLASEGKGFMTDDKLAAWGMLPNNKHAADAVRHGAHYLVFG